MILQALKEYYDRKALTSDSAIAGFERKEIPFVLMLNPDGTPIGLNETYEGGREGAASQTVSCPANRQARRQHRSQLALG